MNKVRKVPLRKCVGCQTLKPKQELIRIVQTPEGEVSVDATGRKNGRGAYLCPDLHCLQVAQKRKSLERALKMNIPEVLYQDLSVQVELAVKSS